MSNNTPTGTRETLKSFLSGINSSEDSISFSHDKQGDRISLAGNEDIKTDPNTNQALLDLDTPGKGMLGDYLSFLTENAEHVYPIKPGNEPSVPTNRGDYLAVSSDHGAEKVFVVPGTQESTALNRYSNSQFQNLSSLIDKVAEQNDDSLGHKALSNIEGTGMSFHGEITNEQGTSFQSGDQNPITQAVQNDVLSNSRFGNIPNKPVYVSDVSSFEEEEKIKINRVFGKHFDTEALIKLENLKSLGASIIMKSSGYSTGETPGTTPDPVFSESRLNSTNIQSEFLKLDSQGVDVDLYRSKNARGAPTIPGTGESIRSGRGEFVTDNRKSHGATYNTGMYFRGKNHKLHKLQAALSITLVKELAKELYLGVVSEYSTSEDSKDVSHVVEERVANFLKLSLGEGSINQISNDDLNEAKFTNLRIQAIASDLFVTTRYPYNLCVNRGLKVLFNDKFGIEGTLGPDVSSQEVTDIRNSLGIASSPGFWLAVANSVIKSSSNLLNKFNEFNSDLMTDSGHSSFNTGEIVQNFIEVMYSDKLIRFMNAIATVGDASFQAFTGESLDNKEAYRKRKWNVDEMPDSPAARVGKSKKKNGYTERQLAWSQNDVPSAYLLPLNPLRASGRLDKIISGPNPFTAMIGSRLADQTYFSKNMDGSNNRIPKEVVKTLENQLDAEYVPFYFHDLRTNEIISFHAFLDQLTDSISPNFSKYSGYGRLDPVQIYEGTTRSINVGFTVVATSKEDFDAMWYKINKFVTLLYPQWTKGTMIGYDLEGDVTSKFVQPNSQVLGASPLVRMRVGDIIKSNYSRFNFARMFGIGDGDVNPIANSDAGTDFLRGLANIINNTKGDILNIVKDVAISLIAIVYGSPVQVAYLSKVRDFASQSNFNSKLVSAGTSVLTNFLRNGFINPLIMSKSGDFGLVASRLKHPKLSSEEDVTQSTGGFGEVGPNEGFIVYLRANYNNGYKITEGELKGKRFMIQRPIRVLLNKKTAADNYAVEIQDYALPPDALGLKLRCNAEDIYQLPNETLVNTLEFGILLAGAGGFIAPGLDFLLNSNKARGFANSTGLAPLGDLVRHLYSSNESNFMDPFNNPFVQAYESTAGRGLAGTIGGVSFDWLSDFPWEIDHNSRAPIGCKISFQFDVIHDIVPGLDHSGYNRAPLYNVGDIMRNVSGDSYESFFKEDEFEYRKGLGGNSQFQNLEDLIKGKK